MKTAEPDDRSTPAPAPAPAPARTPLEHPFRWGFSVTLGVLLALLLGFAAIGLQSVLLSVFIAVFIALGLDPLIRWFQRRGMQRGWAIVTVILLFVLVVAGVVLILIPPLVTQFTSLVTGLPAQVQDLRDSGWFEQLNDTTNGFAATAVQAIGDFLSDPNVWATVGSGALSFAGTVVNAISTSFFVVVLSIYFIATLDQSKAACYLLVSASHREKVTGFAESIMNSIGKYLSGMVVLAFMNAVYSTILMTLVGVPYALLIGVICLFVTLIPLIGTVLTTILMTVVAMFVSPTAAIITLVAMLVYMQIEAYVLTPRIMGKAVQVPGTIVLISALAGGTLMGLLGALVAIPISAGILLIIREVVIPRKALS